MHRKLARVAVLAAAVAAVLVTLGVGVAAAGTTLYDQNDNGGNDGYISSAVPYNSQAADDFVVPATENWNLSSVSALGADFGDLTSVTVTIYGDSAGSPGAQVYTDTTGTFTDATGIFGFPGGDLTIPINATLGPGHYWLSIQGGNSYWYWQIRTVVSSDAAMWENPGGEFGLGCTSWSDMAGCFSFTGDGAPGTLDLPFSLAGTSTPVYAGTPGQASCVGKTISALSNAYNDDLLAAAQALGYSTVKALQQNVKHYCGT